MPRISLEVPVAAEESVVRARLAEAADDPSMVVGWFTSAGGVDARVGEIADDCWDINVNGAAFRASGTVAVIERSPGTAVGVDVDVKPKGLLGTAGVLAAVATGQIDREIRQTLEKEFGQADG